MGPFYRLGLTALALAAVAGSWLWLSTGVAQADGGLLGGALSSDDGQSQDTDDGGLLGSAVETVDSLDGDATGTVGAVTGSEQTAPEEDSGAGAAKAAESEEDPASEPAEASEGFLATVAPVIPSVPAGTDSAAQPGSAAQDAASALPTDGASEAVTGLGGPDRSNELLLDAAAPLAEVLEPVSDDEPATTSLIQTVDRATDNASPGDSTRFAPATGLVARAVEGTLGAARIDRAVDEALVTGIAEEAVEDALAAPVTGVTATEIADSMRPALGDSIEQALSAPVELVVTTLVKPLEPLLTTMDGALEPVTEPLAALVYDVSQPLAPVMQPALSLTEEAIEAAAPSAAVTLNGLVVTETAPPLASFETQETLRGVESVASDVQSSTPVEDAIEPAARTLVPAEGFDQRRMVSGPEAAGSTAVNLKAADEPEAVSARPGTSDRTSHGPAAWLSAILSAERSGPSSIGGLSAVLAALAALFIAPAIAARVPVAMPAPRSPVYLPVYPPD